MSIWLIYLMEGDVKPVSGAPTVVEQIPVQPVKPVKAVSPVKPVKPVQIPKSSRPSLPPTSPSTPSNLSGSPIPNKSSKKLWLIIVGILIVVVLIIFGVFWMISGEDEPLPVTNNTQSNTTVDDIVFIDGSEIVVINNETNTSVTGNETNVTI